VSGGSNPGVAQPEGRAEKTGVPAPDAGGGAGLDPALVTLPDRIDYVDGFVQLSFAQANKLSSERKLHLFIYFYTEWCGPCKELDKKVFPVAAFQEFAASIVSVQVDANSDRGEQVAVRYGVKSYPTMIVCEPGGREIERFFGFSPTAKFVRTIKDYMEYRNTASDYKERSHANPEDLSLAFTAGRELAIRKRGEEAIPFLEKVWSRDKDNLTGNVPRALLLQGKTVYLEQLKQRDKALPLLEQVSKRFPGTFHGTEATYMIARIYLEMRKLDKARDVLQNRVEIDAEDAIQYFRFGSFCLHQSFMLDEAVEKLREGTRKHPKAGYLWKTMADIHFRKKELDKAVSAMEEAARLNPASEAYKRILETYTSLLERRREKR